MNIKMRCVSAFSVIALMVLSIEVQAGPTIVGAGAYSCGEWIAEFDRGSEAAKQAYTDSLAPWAQGYLSALNIIAAIQGHPNTDLPDASVMQVWVMDYCRKNALQNVETAVSELWVAIRVKQGLQPE